MSSTQDHKKQEEERIAQILAEMGRHFKKFCDSPLTKQKAAKIIATSNKRRGTLILPPTEQQG